MKRSEREPRRSNSTRGAAEVLGFVVLIGIVLIGISVVLLAGGSVLDENQNAVELAQAEQALSLLDARASRITLGESTSQGVDLGLVGSAGSLETRPDSGWIQVELVDASDGTAERVVNRTRLGAIRYEHGETTIAYQGGGVWRRDGSSSVMLSRPEFHFQNRTLDLPIISIRGDHATNSEVAMTAGAPAVRKFPNATAGWKNKVSNRTVRITVQSEFYEGWGRYFEVTTSAIVSYDHANERVVVKFLSVPRRFRITDGIIATSGPGKIELLGTGAYIDSYNSSIGDYAATNSANGRVESAGDINLSGDATIDGEVWSGGFVGILSSSATINGDVFHTDGFQNDGTHVGNVSTISGIRSLQPIDGLVHSRVKHLRSANNNSETSVIDGAKLDIAGTSGELGAGDYYLESMSLPGKQLTVNTTEGDVRIGVRDWVKLNRTNGNGGNLTVTGNGTVHVFVGGDEDVTAQITGEGSRNVNLHVGKDSTIHVPGERSHRLRFFGKRDTKATIAGSNGKESSFDGVIYAPAGEFGPGYTYVKHADVYGAVVTGNLTLGQYGEVHFDHGLMAEAFPLAPTAARLDFLYVTEHVLVLKTP